MGDSLATYVRREYVSAGCVSAEYGVREVWLAVAQQPLLTKWLVATKMTKNVMLFFPRYIVAGLFRQNAVHW